MTNLRALVKLTNREVLESSVQIETYTLRHQGTNYDSLLNSEYFQNLRGQERQEAHLELKYECTAQALQYRASFLKGRANKLQDVVNEAERREADKNSFILKLIATIRGNEAKIQELENKIELEKASKLADLADLEIKFQREIMEVKREKTIWKQRASQRERRRKEYQDQRDKMKISNKKLIEENEKLLAKIVQYEASR